MIKKLLFLAFLFIISFSLFSQTTGRRFTTGKVFTTQVASGLNTFDISCDITDEGGYFDGTNVSVGDVLFVSDGGYGYYLPIVNVLSASPSTVLIRVNSTGIPLGAIPNDLGFITKGTNTFKFYPYVSGLSNANQQISNEEFLYRLDSILRFKLIDRISGSLPPAYTPAANQSWLAQNGIGDLYKFNGTTWLLDAGGTTITEFPLTGIGSVLNPIGLDSFSINDAYITQNSIDSTEISQSGISLLNLARNNANSNQTIRWNGTRWVPNDVTVNSISPLSGTGQIGSPLSLLTNSLDSTFIRTGGISRTDIGQNGALIGQVLKWNGSTWFPSNDDTGASASIDSVRIISNNTGLTIKVNNTSSNTLKVALGSIAQGGANNNQVLRWNGTTWNPSAEVIDGDKGHVDVLSGIWTVDTSVIGPIQLQSTGVTAATYGSSTAIPVFTIDADGRVTSATTSSVLDPLPNNEGLMGVANGSGGSSIITSNTSGALGVSLIPTTGISFTNVVSANGGGITFTVADNSPSNEGRLSVTGTGNSRQLGTNTTGSNAVTFAAGDGLLISSTNSTNGGIITFTNSGDLTGFNEGLLTVSSHGVNGARIESNTVGSQSPKFIGLGGTTITVQTDSIMINSASNTTLTAGTGINISGTSPNFTVTNTNPDQTVSLIAGTGIGVTGTYPNFTINNTQPSFNPSTALGGDLSGTLPNPNVVRIRNTPVSSTAPTLNQILKFNGTEYVPAIDTFRWALKAPNGNATTPSYSFDLSQGSGMYAVQGGFPRVFVVGASSSTTTRGTGITLNAGNNTSTAIGGAISITAGSGNSGAGGSIGINGGFSTSNAGGGIGLVAGNGTQGGLLSLTAGSSSSTFNGANIALVGGNAANSSFQGGNITIIGGYGTDTLRQGKLDASITSGILLPRYRRTHTSSIVNPQIGQMVYTTFDTASNGKIGNIRYWNGSEWLPLYNTESGGSSVSEPVGQIVYGTGTGVDSDASLIRDAANNDLRILGSNGNLSLRTTDTTGILTVKGDSLYTGKIAIQIEGDPENILRIDSDSRADSPPMAGFQIGRSFFEDISAAGDNQVYNMGINYSSGGGLIDPYKNAQGIGFETNFRNPGSGNDHLPGYGYFETQFPEFIYSDTIRRIDGTKVATGVPRFTKRRGESWYVSNQSPLLGGGFSCTTDYIAYNDFRNNEQKVQWGIGQNSGFIKGIRFLDTASIIFNRNNLGGIIQSNASGSAAWELLKLDNQNRLVLFGGNQGGKLYTPTAELEVLNSFTIAPGNGQPMILGRTTGTNEVQVNTISPNVLKLTNSLDASGYYLGSQAGVFWVRNAGNDRIVLRLDNDLPENMIAGRSWGGGQGGVGIGQYPDFPIKFQVYDPTHLRRMIVMKNDNGQSALYRSHVNPEGTITANPGDIALVNNAGAGQFWVKETGTGNTGWDRMLSVNTLSRNFEEVNYSATAGATTFTIPITPATPTGSKMPIRVYRNGVKLIYTSGTPGVHQFSYTGNTLTTFACSAGDIISIEYLNF